MYTMSGHEDSSSKIKCDIYLSYAILLATGGAVPPLKLLVVLHVQGSVTQHIHSLMLPPQMQLKCIVI